MVAKKDEFKNNYKLPNRDIPINDEEELDRILDDFLYLASHYMQITDKNGTLRSFKLNRAQRKLVKKILPMIMKDTRVDRRQYVVVLKARQMGASVVVVALINFICAYVEGMNNMHIYHIFPVGGSGAKFYNNKVVPIITGVHPDIYPNVVRSYTDPVTKELTYLDTQGVSRNNKYEIVSSTASSLRGGTGQILILDEVADYEKPYDLEAAIVPAIPQTGFSLIMYLSTFSDQRSSYFLEKIQTARDEPENWTLIFIPWYFSYPEVRMGVTLDNLELTDYDKNVILPALKEDEIPEDEWGDCIAWYHETERGMPTLMKQEYPTTIEEVVELGSNERAFAKEDVEKQRKYISNGERCDISCDIITKKPMVTVTQDSPFCVFHKPQHGHRYGLIADPITSVSDDSDFFAATVMDLFNNEQCATLRGRGLPEEDWAIYCEAIAKWYNRCWICPESNVAEGFKATIWNLGYYNWWYANAANRKNRSPGLRTTVSSKKNMVERLQYLLHNNNIILHDRVWIDELDIFERKVKRRADNSNIVTFSAPKRQHDDCHAKGTLVLTNKGEVPIEKIKVGDMVLTRKGYRKVISTSKRVKPCINRFDREWSPDHPVITPSGDKEFRYLGIHDKIYTWKQRLSGTEVKNTEGTRIQADDICESTIGIMGAGRNHQPRCTHRFGKTIMGRSIKGILSTIKMAIHKIITSAILSALRRNNTWQNIEQILNGQKKSAQSSLKQLGVDEHGYIDVKTVKKNSSLKIKLVLGFVQGCVRAGIMPRWARTYTTTNGSASVVVDIPKLLNIAEDSVTSAIQEEKTLYALTVEDEHEYFADGILVHNTVSTLWIYAGTLDTQQLAGRKSTQRIIVG